MKPFIERTLLDVARTMSWFKPRMHNEENLWVLVKENGTLVHKNGAALIFPIEDAAHYWLDRNLRVDAEPILMYDYQERVRVALYDSTTGDNHPCRLV